MNKTVIIFLSALFCLFSLQLKAETVTYEIVEYNKSTGDFTLKAYGQKPVGSYATFVNDYGATTGNRYNQIPRNQQATLYLSEWEGCTINSITLNMCSNAKSGSAALQVTNGETTLFTMSARDFNSADWYGQWVSKDLGVYVDLTKQMQNLAAITDNDVQITLKGGTSEGSVYLNRITIDYTPSARGTESPLGWKFSQLAAKATINEGDVVMLYRSGSAAGDIDGMETSYYLDAIGIASTSQVYETDVLYFTLSKDGSGNWIFTDQYGRRLGATAKQHLAWDSGVTTWTITLGYSGATIASTNSNYGTLRYNAPESSYARFWNYTSTSLALPYLYRRGDQCEPVQSTALTLSATERTVDLNEQDTVVLKHSFLPSTTTDTRLSWTSSNESVATVNSGIITLLSAGTTLITATSTDGGSAATCQLNVTDGTTAIRSVTDETAEEPRYTIDGMSVNRPSSGIYITNKGRKIVKK